MMWKQTSLFLVYSASLSLAARITPSTFQCPLNGINPKHCIGRNCRMECGKDFHCGFSEKCCMINCCQRCVPMTNKVTPSQCPGLNLPSNETQCSGIKCMYVCQGDSECPGRQKCCRNGCCNGCFDPHRPICPPLSADPVCAVTCEDDFDCVEGFACCYNGCGRMCQPITSSSKMAFEFHDGPNRLQNALTFGMTDIQRHRFKQLKSAAQEPINSTDASSGFGEVRPGRCPVPGPFRRSACVEQDVCNQDGDCKELHKCCANGACHPRMNCVLAWKA